MAAATQVSGARGCSMARERWFGLKGTAMGVNGEGTSVMGAGHRHTPGAPTSETSPASGIEIKRLGRQTTQRNNTKANLKDSGASFDQAVRQL